MTIKDIFNREFNKEKVFYNKYEDIFYYIFTGPITKQEVEFLQKYHQERNIFSWKGFMDSQYFDRKLVWEVHKLHLSNNQPSSSWIEFFA